MKASELRINNYIYVPQRKSVEQIGGIEQNGRFILKDYASSFSDISCAEPIPLTEKWLLKFGFEKLTENAYTYTGGYTLTVFFDGERLSTSFWQGNEKKYVHQLQNLYFALTGEELTLQQ